MCVFYLGHQVLFISADQHVGLCPAQLTLGKVGVHLIAVKICVVGFAVGVVEPQHLEPQSTTENIVNTCN